MSKDDAKYIRITILDIKKAWSLFFKKLKLALVAVDGFTVPEPM